MSAMFESVDVFDSDSQIQVYPVKQPFQVHRVSSGDVSHGRALAFDDLDHSIVIVEIKQRCSLAGNMCVWEPHSQCCLLTFGPQ